MSSLVHLCMHVYVVCVPSHAPLRTEYSSYLPKAWTKFMYKASVNSGSGNSLKYLLSSPATAWMSVSKAII